MDVEDLAKRAWEGVKKSGVPEALHETAFKEIFAALRDLDEGSDADRGGGGASRRKTSARKTTARRESAPGSPDREIPDEDTFFSQLADESGVGEKDLRDVLQVTTTGKVHVIPVTRKLGASKAEQAKSVIALVAGARAYGLGEDPVDAEAVREEAKRKRCYDRPNFAAKHLGRMGGFNAGSNRTEIKVTSSWVGEFKAAVDKARGVEAAKADGS